MDELHQKKQALADALGALPSLAVAYSAGVDSTFLLAVAREILGERVFAVTVAAASVPAREVEEAAAFCKARGIPHVIEQVDQFAIEGFAQNLKNRCYLCKRALFSRICEIARDRGIAAVAEGTNTDDAGDYRPGAAAIAELQVLSPLKAAGLSKADIRALSKEMGLPTWDKPSFACLASRFVYGEEITPQKLAMVEQAEAYLTQCGFSQIRVRLHGSLARIEVPPADIPRVADPAVAAALHTRLRALGFSYVSLDLAGYRTGSMNETL